MSYIIVAGFIVLDFVTGLIKAFKEKGFTSSIMREGLFHKCGSIVCVLFGAFVDYTQTIVDLGITVPIGSGICIYIILMECGSIIENIGTINPKILPSKLVTHFKKLND